MDQFGAARATCSAVFVCRAAARPSSACKTYAADGAARGDASWSPSRRTARVTLMCAWWDDRVPSSHDHQRRSTAGGRRRKGADRGGDGKSGIEGGWYLICRPGGRYFVYRPPRRSREPSDRDRAAGSEPRERVTWAGGVSSAQFTSEAHKMKRGHTLSVVFAPSEHMNRRGGADGRRMEAGED